MHTPAIDVYNEIHSLGIWKSNVYKAECLVYFPPFGIRSPFESKLALLTMKDCYFVIGRELKILVMAQTTEQHPNVVFVADV